MEAYRLTDVILNHADHYSTPVLTELDTVLQAVGIRLWLVFETTLLDAAMGELGRVSPSPQRVHWAAFEQKWREPLEGVRSSATIGNLPVVGHPVPLRASKPHQRPSLQSMTRPYLTGFCAIANDSRPLQPSVYGARRGAGSASEVKRLVAARLRLLAESHPDSACFAQAIRGSGVALRRIGWTVILDEAVQAGAASREPAQVDPALLARLRASRDPQVAAAGALGFLKVALTDIRDVRIVDVDEDGSVVRFGDDGVRVPAELQPMVRAQRIARVRSGADPTHYFLADDASTLTARHVAVIVRVALGLSNGSRPWKEVTAAPTRDERWLLARGVEIRRLKGERVRTAGRIESDKLRNDAIKLLRRRACPIDARCLCPEPHPQPTLLNERFGSRGKGHSACMSHPSRTPW